MRNLIHDVGLKLKTYAICVQIRRVKDGFVSADSPHCLVYPDWELNKIQESTYNLTKIAKEHIRTYDKTVLIGHTKEDNDTIISEAIERNKNEYVLPKDLLSI